ncbi:MAG: sulfotransferase family 2 domain-containing protein, partial [Pseudomonadota bacterium]
MNASPASTLRERPKEQAAPRIKGRQRLYPRQKQLQRLVEQNLPWPMVRSLIRAGTASPWTDHHHRQKCIFVHIPKNAGNSVSQAIYGAPFLGHDPLSHFYAFDPIKAEQCFKFAFSRNPWDRLVSAYHYLKSSERHGIDRSFADEYLNDYATFDEFVAALGNRSVLLAWHHFRPQHEFVQIAEKRPLDFIGKVETIASDFDLVAE